MRALFPKLMALCAALTLVACVAPGSPDPKVKGPNPITGDAIEVTALDAAPANGAVAGKAGQTLPAKDAATAGAAPDQPPAAAAVEKPGQKPKLRPEKIGDAGKADAPQAPEAAPAVPEATKSATQLACEKKGNVWASAGKSGAQACVMRTRDGGKHCTKASQCEGLCLARSQTCAPYKPLFGCNEILQDDGSRVTLCID